MEKIRINEINEKNGGVVVVKYDSFGASGKTNLEATLNTGWQSQEVEVLKGDVGIGGTVDVLIEDKPNKRDPSKPYTNITKIDFSSAVKGEERQGMSASGIKIGAYVPATSRDHSIIAQCMLKVEYRNCPQPNPSDIVESYRYFLKELDE